MEQTTIFLPVSALAGLTFLVLSLIPYQRFSAAFRGQVTSDDFKLGESTRVPPEVAVVNRNLMNLLEMPLLFYVLCLVLYVTHRVDSTAVTCAWIYVGLRAGHSLVHVTYNRVVHRLTFYALSNLVLGILWIRFTLSLLR